MEPGPHRVTVRRRWLAAGIVRSGGEGFHRRQIPHGAFGTRIVEPVGLRRRRFDGVKNRAAELIVRHGARRVLPRPDEKRRGRAGRSGNENAEQENGLTHSGAFMPRRRGVAKGNNSGPPPGDFLPILTADQVRGAETLAVRSGTSAAELMERAGTLAAEALVHIAGRGEVLILAGTGNNGGDGYVMARILAAKGLDVRVAAFGAPEREPARQAYEKWGRGFKAAEASDPARIFVDALFGIGLSRPLDTPFTDVIERFAASAAFACALDLPSGIEADSGTLLSPVPRFDLTISFGAAKPAHLLAPAVHHCGRVVTADIGLAEETMLWANGRPKAHEAAPSAHKFERGTVGVVCGAMPGAAFLAARSAQRSGAGYVTLIADDPDFPASSLVVKSRDDFRSDGMHALVLGPGLGAGKPARDAADWALGLDVPRVVDADMFTLFRDEPEILFGRGDVMTPHEGEFVRLFGDIAGTKPERARAAAARSGNIVLLKGPDTVIAAPDGRAVINAHAHPRLAVQGSGDVLAGVIAAEIARGRDVFAAACAGVWRHGDAGLRAADGLIAEDLLTLI